MPVITNIERKWEKMLHANGMLQHRAWNLRDDLPVHVNPFPVYPDLQKHVKLPAVFVQMALESQPPLFAAHSFTSVSPQKSQWTGSRKRNTQN